MGKPIVREFDVSKTILKFFPYQGAACLVEQDGVSTDENGMKIVKGGTPYPANDSTCQGYLLWDVDVTQGDAPGTYVFEGTIDNKKLAAASISVSSEAKAATPRVTFMD